MKNRDEGMVKTYHRKKLLVSITCVILALLLISIRLLYVCVFQSSYYLEKAQKLHERERDIKALRGEILDRNGVVLASNKTVCTVSVIHSQITQPQEVIQMLVKELDITEEAARKRVEKVSSIERVKTNLSGTPGQILTLTDAWGVEVKNGNEERDEPEKGSNLYTSIDINIQSYAQQLAQKTLEQKQAKSVSIIVMNPENGEILAMTNEPEYDLNNPYELNSDLLISSTGTSKMDLLNNMWRNFCINDTYEPGSIFKMVTATAALETGSVTLNDHFTCGGSAIVADRKIRCHKTTGHGTQTFTQTVMNSCNPAFIEWGRRVGTERFFEYMGKLGLLEKTGIDIAGEASTIIHKQENVGEVELATMSFGQSFQITPLQMLRAASAIINGGNLVTPHFAVKSVSEADGTAVEFNYEIQSNAIEEKTSLMMKDILRQVVEEGGGKKAYLEGFSIGGKTATSQKLPRGSGKYISSFIGFSPVDNAKVIAMCLIDEPQGIYYGGTIAAPVIRELFENILPYLEIQNN